MVKLTMHGVKYRRIAAADDHGVVKTMLLDDFSSCRPGQAGQGKTYIFSGRGILLFESEADYAVSGRRQVAGAWSKTLRAKIDEIGVELNDVGFV